ncbi:MAG TPA: transketolase family protein [Candidatus Vogelbacteria bacterium]|nr:transketolase family protein [Candidatus Vogelbacteria bacterium]
MSRNFLNPKISLNPDVFSLRVKYEETREGFGRGLLQAGRDDKRVVALTADLASSTKTDYFAEEFPERFFEMGVAEQNMAGVSSGLAAMNKVPFIASFAVFSPGRNWEQIRTTICLNNQNVKIIGFHAGVATGPDGATHQALEDLALMRVLPNIIVISPADSLEAEKATLAAARIKKPVYLRFFREKSPIITTPETRFIIGKANLLWQGEEPQVSIISTGITVFQALLAAKKLWVEEKISVQVFNFHTIKPLDTQVLDLAARTGAVVVTEDHQKAGGLGGAIAEYYTQKKPTLMEFVGLNDEFGQTGQAVQLLEHYGLDSNGIITAVKRALKRKN